MSGRGLLNKYTRARNYYEYREKHDYDIDQVRKKADDDNDEINAEWFGDGNWEMCDDQVSFIEEDWEIWADWFPSDES